MKLQLFISIVEITFVVPSLSQLFNGGGLNPQNCVTPDRFAGICVPLSYCPYVTNLFRTNEEFTAVEYLIAAHQICGAINIRGDLLICCVQEQSQPQPMPQIPPLIVVDTRNPFLPERPTTGAPTQLETTTKQAYNPFLPESTTATLTSSSSNPHNPFLPQGITTTTSSPTTLAPNSVTNSSRNPFLPHVFEPEEITTTTHPITTSSPVASTNSPPNPFLPHMIDGRKVTATTAASITTSLSPKQNRKSCDGPYLEAGVCMDIKECSHLFAELKRIPNNEDFRKHLRNLNSLCDKIGYDVCCEVKMNDTVIIRKSEDIPRKLPTPEEGCGYSKKAFFNKIVGGEPSAINAWPWIALLGYNSTSGLEFWCGGTLITSRHVLTAAHCIQRQLVSVRLGEHDLTRDDETQHVDINIIRTEKHPNYNRRNGRADLAVIYLEKNVELSDKITPICLPQTQELRLKSYVNHTPFAVGWGKTMEKGKSSEVLLQIQIPIHENKLCQSTYEKENRYLSEDQFDEAIVCAGALAGGKDTCQGDSGGPLMMPESYENFVRYYLIGVVSYGIGCARPDIPSVYASTQYFMDWIMEKVADTF